MSNNTKENKYVGGMMPKPDWETARDMVSDQERKGSVFLPKPMGEYSGKMILMTDTHLVQQVGRYSAVAHDMSKLDNGGELEKNFDDGSIQANCTSMKVVYEKDKGNADVLSYNQERANIIQKQAEKWAEKNITNSRSRATFLKHVDSFTQDLTKDKQPEKTQQPVKQPEQNKEVAHDR